MEAAIHFSQPNDATREGGDHEREREREMVSVV